MTPRRLWLLAFVAGCTLAACGRTVTAPPLTCPEAEATVDTVRDALGRPVTIVRVCFRPPR